MNFIKTTLKYIIFLGMLILLGVVALTGLFMLLSEEIYYRGLIWALLIAIILIITLRNLAIEIKTPSDNWKTKVLIPIIIVGIILFFRYENIFLPLVLIR